ncbi:MAG TPA: hypothetical protein VMP67_06700, partial [Candidatus Limnocylindria bacterium]|nr:hypothetical protein [Candidatus Limnocylindria bacterium]
MKVQAQAAEQASDASHAGALRHTQAPSAGESGQAGGMSAALDPTADFLLPGQLLSMQGVAGNAAVSRLVAARGNGVQRAPEVAAGLDPKARVDRLRLAIKQNFLVRQHLIVDIEAVASALGGMTAGEGRAVKTEYAKQTGWNLGWLLSGELEIEGKPVVTDVGPANRRRLLTLLTGTVAEPAVDPIAAMETGEKLGRFVGSFVGMEDELGAQAGAVAAVAARDKNLAAETKASGARARAQAIELKVWLDKGQKEKIIGLLAKLATPAAADEKKALSDAYAGQFGEQLYKALTARLKGRDQERVIALWMEDTATAERLALQADLEKLKKAEAQAEKFAPLAKSGIMAKTSKQIQQQRTDARAAVEGRLESIGQEGGDKLQAVLGEGTEGQAVAEQLGVGKDAVITALVRGDRPEALALRLARSDREGTLKAAEIEETLLELRQAAEKEASRQRSAAGRETGAPPLATAEVVNSYFARFQARFAAERPVRLFVQLLAGSVGNKVERERNTALLLQQGVLPEWQELYFAISSSRKDMERVRQILGSKTRSEIRELAVEYRAKTPGNRDLTVDLLGTIEERLLIEKPTADDYMRGRAPKDLAAAREVYEEKKRLLRGGTFEEEFKPGGSEAALGQLAEELAVGRARAPGKPGGPPVPAEIVGSLASMAASEGEVRRLREEAAWVFGRVSSIDTAVMENRGSFARVRDWSGNLEHELVMNARRDAADAHRAVDAALSQDPPDVEAARRSIGELHLIEARMTHNVGVYKQATEEAFNAFVDVAVMAVSMLASGGAAGAIMGAIRATAATIATKATLKGSAYGADEVWADIRGGVFSAGAGKLAEKLVPRLAAAYAAKAKAKGWDKGWAGAVSAKVEPAVMWEVENLISGGGAGLLEAGYQGDIDPLTESVGLTSHAMALGQHAATTPIRRRAERKREARR